MQCQHLAHYETREGIKLDPTKIQKNPGLHTLAKTMLNSMWGKFGQRTNKTQVQEFDNPQKFTAFLDSDKFDVRYVGVLTEQRVESHYRHEVEDDPVAPNLNIFVACSQPVGRGYAFTKPLISCKNASSTLTRTASWSDVDPDSLIIPSVTTWATSRMN